MKKLVFFFIITTSLILESCQPEVTQKPSTVKSKSKEIVIPKDHFDMHHVFFDTSNSTWCMRSDSMMISGYITQRATNGQVLKTFSVFNGKKERVQQVYYPSGQLRFLETYQANRLHGTVKRWSIQNGYQLIALLQYNNGKLHGEQLKWYPTGELHKKMHLKEGKENGLQQAFRKNGVLYANYESKNGRTFGLKRSNLCYELNNEQIVYNQEQKEGSLSKKPS